MRQLNACPALQAEVLGPASLYKCVVGCRLHTEGVLSQAAQAMLLSARYAFLKLQSVVLPAAQARVAAATGPAPLTRSLQDVAAGRAAFLDAARAAADAFDSARLTTLLRIKGQAMAPTLLASAPPGAVETLLVRNLAQPAHEVHRGDVVALRHPEASGGALLVRRVVALPGDTLVSSDEDVEAVALQPGMCWVTRDNEEARRQSGCSRVR